MKVVWYDVNMVGYTYCAGRVVYGTCVVMVVVTSCLGKVWYMSSSLRECAVVTGECGRVGLLWYGGVC